MSLFLAAAALQAAAAIPSSPLDDDRIVVTATRSGDPVRADLIGASVTVLDPAALEARQTRIISDILRDVPGVAVSRAGGVGGLTDIRIRGSEANHVLVLIDGIEVSDPFQGAYDFASLIADDLARVEVLRGQQSSLYGSDAIGGVIQYLTPGGAEAPGIRLRAEGGSFGTAAGAARVAGVAGALDYALSATAYTTDGTPTARDGQRDIGADAYAASAKLALQASELVRLSAVARYSLTRSQFNNSPFSGPQLGLIVDSPGVHSRTEAAYGLVRAEAGSPADRVTGALTAQIADTDRKALSAFGLDYGDKGRRYKGSGEATLRLGDDAVKHRLTAAVDVEREEYRNSSPASPFVFTGKRHTDNVGIVGQYDVTIDDRLAIGGSLRYDDNTRFADATTWRAQASYRFANGLRLRAAGGSGIKNPGFYELYGFDDGRYIGNPDLKPERSVGWEAGIEQAFGTASVVGVTYFDNRLKDEIFTTYPAPNVATPDNRDDSSKQRGIEAFANLRPAPGWRVDLAYTYLHAREDGLREVRRAKHIASANVSWNGIEDRLTLTATLRYNGKQDDLAYTDPSPVPVPVRVVLKDYTLANLAADYKLSETLSLFGRVENLFAQDYEEQFSYATPGRAAYAGVRARF